MNIRKWNLMDLDRLGCNPRNFLKYRTVHKNTLKVKIACERDFYVLRSHMDSTRFELFNLYQKFQIIVIVHCHTSCTKVMIPRNWLARTMYYNNDFEIFEKIEWLETCTIHMTSKHIKISLTSNFQFQCSILWTVL